MEITPAMVKDIREKTGAGMMDCKKALIEAGGDVEKGIEILRKKGIASAEKKASRATSEGVVGCYVHSNRKLAVMVEVNCETDFVARNERFTEMVHNIAMQVAAANPRWVRREDVPAEIVEKEMEIYRDQMKDSGKPTDIVNKIVEGKLDKFYKDNCLVEQVYIKDPEGKMTIKDYVATLIGVIGENIQVRRFVRMVVGE